MGEKDLVKTSIFFAAMCALVVAAYWAQPRPRNEVADPGELGLFFPDLKDPSKPKGLEISDFDEKLSAMVKFVVQNVNGKWVIPTHSNYPADAEERLKKTAAAVYGLRKDSLQGTSKDLHAAMGVVDPTEKGAGATGWGKQIKLFDASNNILAALIVGNEVKDRPGFRFVREPDQVQVYAVDVKDLQLTTKFADWINTKLFDSAWDFERVAIRDYSVDTERGTLDERGTTELVKDATGDFLVQKIGAEEETNKEKARELTSAISDLKITGVRKKPAGLLPNLRTMQGQLEMMEMQDKGFFVKKATDKSGGAEIVSSEGDVIAETKDGLVVTLRFGGLLVGSGDDLTAGKIGEKARKPDPKAPAKKDAAKKGEPPHHPEETDSKQDENRYLLLSIDLDKNKFPEIPDLPPEVAAPVEADKKFSAKTDPGKAGAGKDDKKEPKLSAEDEAKRKEEEKKRKQEERQRLEEDVKFRRKDREQRLATAEKRQKELQARYAEWYYLVPNDQFKKIRLSRPDLVSPKKKGDPNKPEGAQPDFVPPGPPTGKSVIPAKPTPTESTTKPADPKSGVDQSKKDAGKPAAKEPAKGSEAGKSSKPAEKPAPKAEQKPPADNSKKDKKGG